MRRVSNEDARLLSVKTDAIACTGDPHPSPLPKGEGTSQGETETMGWMPLLRPARRDALPEHTNYNDTGCDVHSSCLTCPLVRCRYDAPGGARRLLSEERDRTIIDLQKQRVAVNAIAQRFGISRRTVFRVLARYRK